MQRTKNTEVIEVIKCHQTKHADSSTRFSYEQFQL